VQALELVRGSCFFILIRSGAGNDRFKKMAR